MIRNSRTPTLMIVGLVIVIIIITYNYWNLLDRNTVLRDKLMMSEEKIIDLNEKKASLEKQASGALDQIKSFEEKTELNSQALLKKDSEIDELNSKLRIKSQENEKLISDNADFKEKLTECTQTGNSKLDDLQKKYDLLESSHNELKLNMTNIESKKMSGSHTSFNCTIPINDALLKYKAYINGILKSTLDQTNLNAVLKLLQINQTGLNSEQPATLEKKSFILEKEATKVKSTETTTLKLFNIPRVVKDSEIKSDICTLAKDPGTCENSTERYYYDSESERCLDFAYSGCEGNANNFLTIEECEMRCLNNNVIENGLNDTREVRSILNKSNENENNQNKKSFPNLKNLI